MGKIFQFFCIIFFTELVDYFLQILQISISNCLSCILINLEYEGVGCPKGGTYFQDFLSISYHVSR